ncbi:MAG: transcription repressor NadR [Lentihominibacter sp.]
MSKRCDKIKEMLMMSSGAVTASALAEKLGVSRQIIVGDIALLRAAGEDIVATSRGYIINSTMKTADYPFVGVVACRHTDEQLREELYTIVDFGATVIDVTIEHAIYGELSGKLNLSSRYDVDCFIKSVEEEENSAPISVLTGGVHLHRLGCRDKEIFEKIRSCLEEKGIAISE